MQLSKVFSPVADTLLKLPHAKIAKLICLALLIYVAYILAKITWLFLDEKPQHNQRVLNVSSTQVKASSPNYNLLDIQSLNLFGIYNQAVVNDNEPEDIEDAPETNLKLTLTGIVASDDEKKSAAIIENNGVQEVYGIDETIKGTRAVLKKIHNDRVHIRHSGRLETLMLDGLDYDESNRANKQKKTQPKSVNKVSGALPNKPKSTRVDNRKNDKFSLQAQTLRNDINEDPGKIRDYLKISPKRENGKIIGYLLRPGENPEFFKASGLKSGDVAIEMNGYDLTQIIEAAQALKALKEEQEISLLVKRRDDITEILFSINN